MTTVIPPASRIERSDYVAWILSAIVLALIIQLHLLPALIAALLVYKLVDVLTPWLRVRAMDRDVARLLAVALIAAVVIAALVGIGIGIVALLKHSGQSPTSLLQRMALIIEEARPNLPLWLASYIPEDAETLRQKLVEWLRSHTDFLQLYGQGLGRGLVHVIMGMVIGALLSLQKATQPHERRPLTDQFAQHGNRLASAFQRVVFAQFWISLINTFFTWLYLDVVLRLFGVDLPLVKILVLLTFVVGLMPIIGNLISNTAIVIVCLSQGVGIAAVSLAYLVIIHKLEYFLNARIIGSHVNAKAWELLIAMLVMQAIFGIPGLIAAPIFYAFFKDEFRAKGLV